MTSKTLRIIRLFKKIKKRDLFALAFLCCFVYGLYFMITEPVYFYTTKSPRHEILPEALQKHVEILSNYKRASGTGRLQSIQYIVGELKSQGIKKIEFQDYQIDAEKHTNIIVHFQAKNPTSYYILGAHYDASDDRPGADDNASGVAGVIEIAKYLQWVVLQNTNIDLVFYSSEEPPAFGTEDMGSFHHAKSISKSTLTPEAMVFDAIGYYSDQPGSQNFPTFVAKWLYSDVGDSIAIVGNLESIGLTRKVKSAFLSVLSTEKHLRVESISMVAKMGGIDFSDHRNYRKFGFPAVMITDTAFFRNSTYHAFTDLPDTLDYKRMSLVVSATVEVLLHNEK